jgi:hypothetical protein
MLKGKFIHTPNITSQLNSHKVNIKQEGVKKGKNINDLIGTT